METEEALPTHLSITFFIPKNDKRLKGCSHQYYKGDCLDVGV